MSAISHNGKVASGYFSRLLEPARVSATTLTPVNAASSAIAAVTDPDIEEWNDSVAFSGRAEPLESVSDNDLSGSAAPAPAMPDRRRVEASEASASQVSNPHDSERTTFAESPESGRAEHRSSPGTPRIDTVSSSPSSLDTTALQSRWSSAMDVAPDSTSRAAISTLGHSMSRSTQDGSVSARGERGERAQLSQTHTPRLTESNSEPEAATPPVARDMLGQVLRWVATAPDPAATAHAEAATTTLMRQPMTSALESERQMPGATMPPQAARSLSLVPLGHPSGSTLPGARKAAGGEPVAPLEEVVRLSIGDIRVRVEPPAAPTLAQPAQTAPRATSPSGASATASGLRRRCIHL